MEKEIQDEQEENLSSPLELIFEEEGNSVANVIRQVPFPVVAVCDSLKCPIPIENDNLTLDLRQPVLFYRKRNIQKIPARSMFFDDSLKEYREIGDPLIIPEDYKGFFAILKRRSVHVSKVKEESTPYFCSIKELADSDTEQFLIGGQNKIQAMRVIEKQGDNFVHQDKYLFPGDILRSGKILVFETKKKRGLLRRGSIVSEKYLSCTDETDKEILIPFTENGCFYSLSSSSGKLSCPVMQMSDIVAQKCIPCVVKLVYGRVPSTPCYFSGLLKLESAYMERSIIASTITNKRNILVELPSSCDLNFNIAIPSQQLLEYKGYKNSLSICSEKSCSYMQNMKVCQGMRNENLLRRPHSQISQNSYAQSRISYSSEDSRNSRMNIDDLGSQGSSVPSRCSDSSMGDADYMPMHGSGDSYVKMQLQPDGLNSLKMDECEKVKLFVEHSLYELPVCRMEECVEETKPNTTKRPKSIILDALLGPPPEPCEGSAPSPCYGMPVNNIEIPKGGMPNMARRPSTFVFTEPGLEDLVEENHEPKNGEGRRGSEPNLSDISRRRRKDRKSKPKFRDDSVVPTPNNIPNTIHEDPKDQSLTEEYENGQEITDSGDHDVHLNVEDFTNDILATSNSVHWLLSQSSITTENSENVSNRSSEAIMGDVEDDIVKQRNTMCHGSSDHLLNVMNQGKHDDVECYYSLPKETGFPDDNVFEKDQDKNDPSLMFHEEAPPTPHIKNGEYTEITDNMYSEPSFEDDDGYECPAVEIKQENQSCPMGIPQISRQNELSHCSTESFIPGSDKHIQQKKPPACLPKTYQRARSLPQNTYAPPGPPVPLPKPCKATRDRALLGVLENMYDGQLESCPARIDTTKVDKKTQNEWLLQNAIESFTKEKLDEALKEQGIKTSCREFILSHMTVREFLDMDLDQVEETLPCVGRTDISKIAMFVRSWKLPYI